MLIMIYRGENEAVFVSLVMSYWIRYALHDKIYLAAGVMDFKLNASVTSLSLQDFLARPVMISFHSF